MILIVNASKEKFLTSTLNQKNLYLMKINAAKLIKLIKNN